MTSDQEADRKPAEAVSEQSPEVQEKPSETAPMEESSVSLKPKAGPFKTVVFVLTMAGVALTLAGIVYDAQSQLETTFKSPDGKFAVEVYAYPRLLPGKSPKEKGPGKVRLVTGSGVPLDQAPLNTLSSMSEPKWTKDRVHIENVADFLLPEEQGK